MVRCTFMDGAHRLLRGSSDSQIFERIGCDVFVCKRWLLVFVERHAWRSGDVVTIPLQASMLCSVAVCQWRRLRAIACESRATLRVAVCQRPRLFCFYS